MSPFDSYPSSGRLLIGHPKNWAVCRYGYGLELQRATGQTACIYCCIDLVGDYHRWLLLSVDHVVPRGQAILLGIGADYYDDMANLALCCSGCNGFGNRYRVPEHLVPDGTDWTVERFLLLRDRVFLDRAQRIAERRAKEVAYFGTKPWEVAALVTP